MIRVYLFIALMWGSCLYAIFRGGWAERTVAVIFLVGSILTQLEIAPGSLRFQHVELGVVLVDIVAFLLFFGVALFSKKYWPLWMTAMQGVALLAHFAPLMPMVIPLAYANAITLWSWPMLVLLALVTYAHRRMTTPLRY